MASVYKTKNLQGHERPMKHIKFSPDNKHIFSAGADRKVIKWDYKKNIKEYTYNQNASINVICISNSGKYMFTGDSTGLIYVWDISINELIKLLKYDLLYNISNINISSDDVYLIVTFSQRAKKGNSLVGIFLTEKIITPIQKDDNNQNNNNNILQIPNPNSDLKSKEEQIPEMFKKIVCTDTNTKFNKSCFTNNNKSILISREDGYLEKYDFTTDKLISSNKFHNDIILDLDVNDEYGIILISSKDGEMSLINLNSFQLINKFKPENPVRNLNSCQIAIIDNPYYIIPGMKQGISIDTLFDLNTMDITKLRYFENKEDQEKALKFKNKKKIVLAIVAGGQDSKFVTTTDKNKGGFEIIIYNAFTGEKLAEFLEHFSPVNTLAVHDNILVSGAEDGSVKIHEIEHYIFS